LLAGSAAAALQSVRLPPVRLVAWPIVLWALAQVFYWSGLMFELIGVGMPLILIGFAFLAALPGLGLALRATAWRAVAV